MQSPKEIFGVRGIVFTTQQDMGRIDTATFECFADSLVEEIDASPVVENRKGFDELVPQSVAKQSQVLVPGEVQRNHQDSIQALDLAEEFSELWTLILID